MDVQEVMLTVSALQDILSKDENYQRGQEEPSPEQPEQPEEPSKPDQQLNQNNRKLSTIRLWTAWQKLSRKKSLSLDPTRKAKKKLLEIADQANCCIQES